MSNSRKAVYLGFRKTERNFGFLLDRWRSAPRADAEANAQACGVEVESRILAKRSIHVRASRVQQL